ncbi:MAG TPA: hypothetical protein VN698_07060 [Bacteroidia bacterium]|nr:hypothetical protein [Bacteroidia bacterium]
MLTTITTNVAGGIILFLFTIWYSWHIWRRREKLILSYTVTESDLFPIHNAQGKYYAIKISNNGGKLIKNITADITISDAEIDKITNHDLITNLEKKDAQVKFSVELLNPKEDIDFVITSKVKTDSKFKIKIRGEGVNAFEKINSPSKTDVVGTAIIWAFIGFFFAFVYINIMTKDNPTIERMDNVFGALNKAGLPHVFQQIIDKHDDISYEGTAFYLMNSYLRDTTNREKYINALKNLVANENVALNSKGVACYLIYKIDLKAKNSIEANEYLNKCKTDAPDTYKFLFEQDQHYNIDSIQTHLMKNK